MRASTGRVTSRKNLCNSRLAPVIAKYPVTQTNTSTYKPVSYTHLDVYKRQMLEGTFLVRVDRVFYRWHPERPFYVLRLAILEPQKHRDRSLTGRLYCTPKALWKLRWFLRDFGYDLDLMGQDEVDEKALRGLRGIVRISHATLNLSLIHI